MNKKRWIPIILLVISLIILIGYLPANNFAYHLGGLVAKIVFWSAFISIIALIFSKKGFLLVFSILFFLATLVDLVVMLSN